MDPIKMKVVSRLLNGGTQTADVEFDNENNVTAEVDTQKSEEYKELAAETTYVAENAAEPFSNTTEYEVGDWCIYEDGLYACISHITTPGDWDSTKWEKVTIEDKMKLKADLVGGKVPANQLPSYVDDVIEGYLYNGAFYSDAEHTHEIEGEEGKIYVDLSSNLSYRWSGTIFVQVGGELPPYTPSDRGKFLGINEENHLAWQDVPEELPSQQGASEGDVLKIGDNGLEWGSGGGIDTDVTVEIETTASDAYNSRTNYATAISLQQFIANCEAGNVYTEGTIARISNLIGRTTFRLLLIGTNHEVLAYNDTEVAKTTWQFLDMPQHNVRLGLPFNLLDWYGGSGRTYLMEYLNGINSSVTKLYPSNADGIISAQGLLEACHTIYESLPDTLKRHIKTVRRYCYRRRNYMNVGANGGSETNDAQMCELACNVFHLAGTDLGLNGQSGEGSGSKYNYFTDGTRRTRFYNGSAGYWWTASPYTSYSGRWYCVDGDGSNSDAQNDTRYGVAPAFCI